MSELISILILFLDPDLSDFGLVKFKKKSQESDFFDDTRPCFSAILSLAKIWTNQSALYHFTMFRVYKIPGMVIIQITGSLTCESKMAHYAMSTCGFRFRYLT